MGAVFEAEDLATGGRVALKVMLDQSTHALLRFKREFRAVADLHHPNLVRLLELNREGDRWFLIMELVEGQDLHALMLDRIDEDETASLSDVDAMIAPVPRSEPGPDPLNDASTVRAILSQMLDGLQHLHAHGVVHGDLKPGNVLVGHDGVVRLADFGLVNTSDFVTTGVVGTIQYLAPELHRGDAPSPASDLYAVGVMLFRLLTGQYPYERYDAPPPQTRTPRADDRVRGVPAALVDVIAQLMDPLPERRPSIAALRTQLGLASRMTTFVPQSPVFVGRNRALLMLDRVLDSALAGQAHVVTIAGPSGIGKTTLAAHVAHTAAERGLLTLTGRCHEREHIPFVVFDRVIDQLVAAAMSWSQEDRASLGEYAHVLRSTFPVLEALVVGDVEPVNTTRSRSFAALSAMIRQAQQVQPLLLVLDDVQWLDLDSEALLNHLLAAVSGHVTIALLYRTNGSDPPTRTGHSARAVRIDLDPLGAAEVRELAQARGRAHTPLGDEGNPFLLSLLLNSAEGGDPARVLDRKLDALLPSALFLVSWLVVSDDDVADPTLRAVSELDASAFDRAIGELCRARLIHLVPARDANPLAYGMYHHRITEAALLRLDAGTRRTMHRRIALVLEATEGSSAATLHRHWEGAGDADKRRHYVALAIDEAERKLAFANAGHLCRTAAIRGDVDDVREAWERTGDLFVRAGLLVEAGAAYEEALGRANMLAPTQRAQLLARVAETQFRTGLLTRGVETLARARQLLRLPVTRPGNPIRNLVSLATTFLPPWRYRRSDEWAEARVHVLEHQAYLLLPLWPLLSLEATRRYLRAARHGAPQVRLRGLVMSIMAPVLLGTPRPRRVARARRAIARAATLGGRPAGQMIEEQVMLAHAALQLITDHRGARAGFITLLHRMDTRGLGDTMYAAIARTLLSATLLQLGEHRALLDRVRVDRRRVLGDFIGETLAWGMGAEAHAALGRVDEARDWCASLQEHVGGAQVGLVAFTLRRTQMAIDHAAGIPQAVLDQPRAGLVERHSYLLWFLDMEYRLEASITLHRHGKLSPAQRRTALRHARRMTRNPAFGADALGWRVLAHLTSDHCALGEALTRSRWGPLPRWRALLAARDLEALDDAGQTELYVLTQRYGYARPELEGFSPT
jgi:hypothetical protein